MSQSSKKMRPRLRAVHAALIREESHGADNHHRPAVGCAGRRQFGALGWGGFILTVPILTYVLGVEPREAVAVGTSLLVIVMKSFAGFAGYLFSVQLQWPVLIAFTAMAIAGSFVGVKLAGLVPERTLRKGFGWFVLAMGAFVLAQEVPHLLTDVISKI